GKGAAFFFVAEAEFASGIFRTVPQGHFTFFPRRLSATLSFFPHFEQPIIMFFPTHIVEWQRDSFRCKIRLGGEGSI
ncbi:MAG: hypothetical protein VYA84_20835, partial [Planctomycetota bacterium]|nr:hypothetical protein [Planctomycetota bacterium]